MAARIGIKFCGSCNPQIHTGEMFRLIREVVAQMGMPIEFVSPDLPEINGLLVISGCPHDCAGRPVTAPPEVVIRGENLDLSLCAKERIPAAAVEKLLNLWRG